MSYLIVAIIAWSIFSVSTLIDKYLLNKPIGDAKVYTFYTGLFAIFIVIIFLPFAGWPGLNHFLFDISCGGFFLISLYFLFAAIQKREVSQVIPLVGALTPIFALIIEHVWFNSNLRPTEYMAFFFLVLGTFTISYEKKFHSRNLILPILAALLGATYYVVVKSALTPFSSNFAWVRLGSVIAAAAMLLHPHIRAAVFKTSHSLKSSASNLFLIKSVLAGAGFIVLNYAISIGDPALVNSLQGIEYALIFIMVVIISAYRPKILHENLPHPMMLQKIAAIMFIFTGLVLLSA